MKRLVRPLWIAAGFSALGLGILGIALPLLPTTPFVLLAAFCFARGSERLHDWLIRHPRFGPAIRDWRLHGAISRKGKRLALIAILAAFLLAVLGGAPGWALALQALTLLCVAVFLLTRPDPPGE